MGKRRKLKIKGKHFIKTQNIINPISVKPLTITNNHLISCYRCGKLFIAHIEPMKEVRCTHCRRKNQLRNPRYYKPISNQWTDAQIRAFNNYRTIDQQRKMIALMTT